MSVCHTRPLSSLDCFAYRALRQRILNTPDARFFSDSYEREALLTEAQWLDWCQEKKEHCILGTIDGNALIGIIMITRQGDSSSPVVEWEAAWVDPKYRRTNVGRSLYEHARQWTKLHGYKYIAGFIRDEYTPSRDICLGMGFTHVYMIPDEQWADGSFANTEALLLDLRPNAHLHQTLPVGLRFKEAVPYLERGQHAPPKPKKTRQLLGRITPQTPQVLVLSI